MKESCHFKKELPLFHASYDVFIGPDIESIKDHIETTYSKLDFSIPANSMGYTSIIESPLLGKGLIVVLNDFLAEEEDIQRTIYHEAVHITWMILGAIGVKLTADNHEVQAYLIEHVITDLQDAYKEYEKSCDDMTEL